MIRRSLVAAACCLLSSCVTTPEEEPYVIPTTAAKLEDFFYPTAPGAEYHPRANQPPPFWPPHEHIIPPEVLDSNRFPFTVLKKGDTN